MDENEEKKCNKTWHLKVHGTDTRATMIDIARRRKKESKRKKNADNENQLKDVFKNNKLQRVRVVEERSEYEFIGIR